MKLVGFVVRVTSFVLNLNIQARNFDSRKQHLKTEAYEISTTKGCTKGCKTKATKSLYREKKYYVWW